MTTDIVNLSQRLAAIATCVPEGGRLADIGSDHALLPVFLCQTGRVERAVAGELNPGPLEAARRQVAEAGLSGRIDVRAGDGLSVLAAGEADTVTIAGMGGNLIAQILQDGLDAGKLAGVNRLVLQPNVAEDAVRRWLFEHRWVLAKEQILEEDGKIYEILVADAGRWTAEAAAQYDGLTLACGLRLNGDWLYRFGPHLVREASPVFRRKWAGEIGKLEAIVAQLARSALAASAAKAESFRREIDMLREVLACLPKDNGSFS